MTPASPDRTDWLVAAAVILAGVMASFQIGKVPPALPRLMPDLALSLVAAGWAASLFNVVGACCGAVAGAFVDRRDAGRLIVACLCILSLGGLLGAVAQNGWFLILSRFCESLGFVGIVVAGPRLLVRFTRPRHQPLALGIWGAYMPVGMAVMMLAAPQLLSDYGWRGLWLINAVLVGGYVLVLHAVLRGREAGPGGTGTPVPALARSLRSAGGWLLGAAFAVYALQWFALMTWLPTFLLESQQATQARASVFTALLVGSNAIGNFTSAWLLYRGARRWRLMVTAYVAMAVGGTVALAPFAAAELRLAAALLFSMVGGLLPAAVLAGAPRHAPDGNHIATLSGMIVQGANIGSVLGPPLLAIGVSLAGDWHQGYWLILACSGLGLGLTAGLGYLERR